jgi:hypothetical protein
MKHPTSRPPAPLAVERIQTGVRMEKRMVKVLKALAERVDLGLGELLEDIVLHAFEGVSTFGASARPLIRDLKRIYGMDYGVHAAARFRERTRKEPTPARSR